VTARTTRSSLPASCARPQDLSLQPAKLNNRSAVNFIAWSRTISIMDSTGLVDSQGVDQRAGDSQPG
jgi:hypothetical protein